MRVTLLLLLLLALAPTGCGSFYAIHIQGIANQIIIVEARALGGAATATVPPAETPTPPNGATVTITRGGTSTATKGSPE